MLYLLALVQLATVSALTGEHYEGCLLGKDGLYDAFGYTNVTASDGVILPVRFGCNRHKGVIKKCALAADPNRQISIFVGRIVKSEEDKFYILECRELYGPQLTVARLADELISSAWQQVKSSDDPWKFQKVQIDGEVQLPGQDAKVPIVYTIEWNEWQPYVYTCEYPEGSRLHKSVNASTDWQQAYVVHNGTDYDFSCYKFKLGTMTERRKTFADELCSVEIADAWQKVTSSKAYPSLEQVQLKKEETRSVAVADSGDTVPIVYTVACLQDPFPTIEHCRYDGGTRLNASITIPFGESAYILINSTEYLLTCYSFFAAVITKKPSDVFADSMCEATITANADAKSSGKALDTALTSMTVKLEPPQVAGSVAGHFDAVRVRVQARCFGRRPEIRTCQQRLKLKKNGEVITAGNSRFAINVAVNGSCTAKLYCYAFAKPEIQWYVPMSHAFGSQEKCGT